MTKTKLFNIFKPVLFQFRTFNAIHGALKDRISPSVQCSLLPACTGWKDEVSAGGLLCLLPINPCMVKAGILFPLGAFSFSAFSFFLFPLCSFGPLHVNTVTVNYPADVKSKVAACLANSPVTILVSAGFFYF